jgi:hypothetical protein
MFGGHFYHAHIRKAVAAFGSLFDDIYVIRKDSGGQVLNQTRVPLSYAPKRKYLERIQEMSVGEELERQIAVKLPRMSFEIVALQYDAQRQLPKTNKLRCGTYIDGDNTSRLKLYTPVPYMIQFQVNIYSKNQDDALQVVEQILPFFAPQYTLSWKPIDNVDDIVEDIPVALQGVTFIDDFEGPIEQRRTIIYTLEFEMKLSFYGQIDPTGSGIIRTVDGQIINSADLSTMETVRVTPDPIDVGPDSDYGFNVEIIPGWDSA